MEAAVLEWISSFSSALFRLCAILFVAVNLAAVATVALTRDRSLVQRWTSPFLATNLILVVAGLGTPLLAGMAKFAVKAMAGAGAFLVQFVK